MKMKWLILAVIVSSLVLLGACKFIPAQTTPTPEPPTPTPTPTPTPAAFSVSNLTIEPTEVQPNERVTITVSVANTGGTQGSHTVALKINGVNVANTRVTVAAGDSDVVSFTVSKESIGSYSVAVDGLRASFTVVVPPPMVLYSDDFSDETSGWDTFEDESGWVSYKDGWLHVTNYTSAELATFSRAHQYFEDFILEVETKLVDGTDDNYHQIGVRCNEDEGNVYNFGVSADGYYQLIIEIAGSGEVVIEPTPSSHILQGWDVVNLIRIECVGSTLRLLVNEHLLKEFTDSRLQGGDITLGTSSLAGTFSEIAFDNIVVTAP